MYLYNKTCLIRNVVFKIIIFKMEINEIIFKIKWKKLCLIKYFKNYIFKKINSSSFENFSFINDWFMYFLFVMIHSSQNWMVVATNLCELQLSNSERSHLISSFSFFSLHRLYNYLPTRKSIHPNIDESRWTMINEI